MVLALEGMVASVILLQAFMPAAIYTVVTAVLFELDAALASSLMVCNTIIFLLLILPLIFLLKSPLLGM